MKLQDINYENMILVYHICRYIMLPLFTSYRKSEICFKYLRMLSRMKASYIFYFQFSYHEIHIINMYVIIHGSVIIYMFSKAVCSRYFINCKCVDSMRHLAGIYVCYQECIQIHIRVT